MGIHGVDLSKEQKGEGGSLSADLINTSPQHESGPADKGMEQGEQGTRRKPEEHSI